MITRFLLAFWLLLQVSVAGPGNQLLLSYKAPSGGGGGLAVVGAFKNTSTTTTCAVTVSGISTGDLLVACFSEYNVSTEGSAMTDNLASAGWTKVAGTSDGLVAISIWYLANASSSITTVTGTRSTGATDTCLVVHRVTGASTSTPFTSGERATANGGSANPQTSAVSNATAASIYFAAVGNNSGANPATYTINSTGTTGTWAIYDSTNSQELDGSAHMTINVPYQIVSSTASRGHGWNTSTSQRYAAAVAVFH